MLGEFLISRSPRPSSQSVEPMRGLARQRAACHELLKQEHARKDARTDNFIILGSNCPALQRIEKHTPQAVLNAGREHSARTVCA